MQVSVGSIHNGCKREPSIEEKERERDALELSGRDFLPRSQDLQGFIIKACNEDVKERRDRGTHRNHLAEIAILRRGIGELDSTPARFVVGDEAEQSLLPHRLLLSAFVHSCHNRATASPPDLAAAYRRSWG